MEKTTMLTWLASGNVTIPLLLLENYKELGLQEKEVMLLIHLHANVERGYHFPTPAEIASKMTCSFEECCELLRKLVQQGFLAIEDKVEAHSIRTENYSLLPLWEKLIQLLTTEQQDEQNSKIEVEEDSLYTTFEREFGRPLSPMECETLSMWIDQDNHSFELISAALKEAVLSGKMNFRYIDRILFDWKRNGIKTLAQAKDYGKKFRGYTKKDTQQAPAATDNKDKDKNTSSTPFYHWLEKP
jgi:DNA replication protein